MAPPRPEARTAPPHLAWAAAGLVALGLAGWLWNARALVAEHLAQGRADATAQLAMDYGSLLPDLDESALQRRYAGPSWQCTGGPQARQCTAAVAGADGVAASTITAHFTRSRLRMVVLQLPWWQHHAMARALVRTLGAPDAYTVAQPTQASASLAWQLPGGRLHMPREPGLQPLRWTELRWTAHPDAPARP